MMPAARWLVLTAALTWPLQPLDDAVQGWLRARQHPGTRAVMQQVSNRAGLALALGVVGGLLAGPVGRACVLEVFVALVPVNLAVEGLKWTVNRTRPDGSRDRKNSSFPSSHAANAFTVAAVLAHRFARRRWSVGLPLWLVAATVAFSRMYLDRHWLSDCVGSLLLASGGAWLAAWFMLRRRRRSTASPTA
jgi:membrane-associated phospholipid phosphatase